MTLSDRLKICELMKNGRSLRRVAAEFESSKSKIHDIVKNPDKLQSFLTEILEGDCVKEIQIVRRADLELLHKDIYVVR